MGRHSIAPSWMTMEYIFQKPFCRSMPSRASEMRRCAVELTGRNSVRPSMMPSRTERKLSCKTPPKTGGRRKRITGASSTFRIFSEAALTSGVRGESLLQGEDQRESARLPVAFRIARGQLLRDLNAAAAGFLALVALVVTFVDLDQRALAPRCVVERFSSLGRLW